jgi:hypothetical protein
VPLQRAPVEGCKQSWARFDQNDPRTTRVDGAEIRCQRALRQFSNGASHLHPGRTAADHSKIEESTTLTRIGLGLGTLEGKQDPAAENAIEPNKLMDVGRRATHSASEPVEKTRPTRQAVEQVERTKLYCAASQAATSATNSIHAALPKLRIKSGNLSP